MKQHHVWLHPLALPKEVWFYFSIIIYICLYIEIGDCCHTVHVVYSNGSRCCTPGEHALSGGNNTFGQSSDMCVDCPVSEDAEDLVIETEVPVTTEVSVVTEVPNVISTVITTTGEPVEPELTTLSQDEVRFQPLTNPIPSHGDCICGKDIQVSCSDGGDSCKVRPWVTRIKIKKGPIEGGQLECAGSLINRKLILSAAHCFCSTVMDCTEDLRGKVKIKKRDSHKGGELSQISVFLGRDMKEKRMLHKLIIHPLYYQADYGEGRSHDIAILVLESITNHMPICLPPAGPTTPNDFISWPQNSTTIPFEDLDCQLLFEDKRYPLKEEAAGSREEEAIGSCFQQDISYPGWNMDTKLLTESAEECQNLCKRKEGCKVFTWVRPSRSCELKEKLTTGQAFPEAISGPASCEEDHGPKATLNCHPGGSDYALKDKIYIEGRKSYMTTFPSNLPKNKVCTTSVFGPQIIAPCTSNCEIEKKNPTFQDDICKEFIEKMKKSMRSFSGKINISTKEREVICYPYENSEEENNRAKNAPFFNGWCSTCQVDKCPIEGSHSEWGWCDMQCKIKQPGEEVKGMQEKEVSSFVYQNCSNMVDVHHEFCTGNVVQNSMTTNFNYTDGMFVYLDEKLQDVNPPVVKYQDGSNTEARNECFGNDGGSIWKLWSFRAFGDEYKKPETNKLAVLTGIVNRDVTSCKTLDSTFDYDTHTRIRKYLGWILKYMQKDGRCKSLGVNTQYNAHDIPAK